MTIDSWPFLGFLVAAVAVFHGTPGRWRAGCVFPLTSLAFLLLVEPSRRAAAAVLGFAALLWLASWVVGRRPGLLAAVIAVLLVMFGWLKAYWFLSFLPLASRVPATVGLSYLLLRGLQLVIDRSEDRSLRPGPVEVLSFLAAWPCLVSGPVQRYQDFARQCEGMARFRLDDEVLLGAFGRMARGWLLVLVFGDFAHRLWSGLEATAVEDAYPLAFGGAQLAFLLYLYFDFAGYTDIVLGAGRLFGLDLPENFAHPFASRSFLEFWQRWHMSMSNWFRVYVFGPLLKALTVRSPDRRAAPLLGAVAFFGVFFLVGLWHGTTSGFVLLGLLLGIGASVNQGSRTVLRGTLGKQRFDRLGEQWWYGMLAKGLTFAYLCAANVPLWMTTPEMVAMARRYGPAGLLLSQGVVFVVMAATAVVPWPAVRGPRSTWARCLLIAAMITAIEMYAFLFPSSGGRFFYEQY